MAAVTINTRNPQNTIGKFRQQILNISIVTTGDTFNTGFESVMWADCSPNTNRPTVITATGGGTTPVTLAFTVAGAYTGNLHIVGT